MPERTWSRGLAGFRPFQRLGITFEKFVCIMENRHQDRPVRLLPARSQKKSRFSVPSTNAGLFIFRILRHRSKSLVLRSGASILLVVSLSSASISAPQNPTLQKARDAFVRAQEME